jgi:4-hydroxy-tetrahydrodipicolinate synthase
MPALDFRQGGPAMRRTFQGSLVAMVTPFRDGRVDEDSLRELVEFHVSHGTDGLVPCGTTGESPTLSPDEHHRVVEIVIEQARGRVPVIAGTGSNSTAATIELTRHAARAGAAGALLVAPYYNRPTQRGLYEHFRAVAEAVPELPLVIYNIQGRTAVNVETETLQRLAELPNIVGVKEASGSLDQMTAVILACGPDFTVLSGDDTLTLPLMAVGGRGVISVVANLLPREVVEITHAALEGDWKRAREAHLRLFPVCKAMFIETNPIPVKEAMAMLGLLRAEWRLPMCAMSPANRERLRTTLVQAGVLRA